MTDQDARLQPFRLEPGYRDYVWGGSELRPNVPGPTAEVWMIYEHNRILDGPLAGRTLAEACQQQGVIILGSKGGQRGLRFPLLIKLLDCADWLSLQVHPNDEQAHRLEGPGENGKTEAWHILSATPGASLYCGIKPGTSKADLEQAIRDGSVIDLVQKLEMNTGDTLLIRAGIVHALGPGLMIYEVQQTSDLTYRVYDWGRLASQDRPIHIDKSLDVINLHLQPVVVPPARLADGGQVTLVHSEYFCLDLIGAQQRVIDLDTRGETFHALTTLEGRVRLEGANWSMDLARQQSVVVPAAAGKYRLVPVESYSLLRAAVE